MLRTSYINLEPTSSAIPGINKCDISKNNLSCLWRVIFFRSARDMPLENNK